jgi:hypothetical protein
MSNRARFEQRESGRTIHQKFLEKTLRTQGQELLEEQKEAIERFVLIDTGEMRDERSRTSKDIDGYSGTLQLTFKKHLRFQDMKRKPKANKDGKTEVRKQTPIYNRLVWGRVNQIAKELAFGFSEAVKDELAHDQNLEIQ